MTLYEHEHIAFEIEHTKKLPFRLEDWIRSSLFVGLSIAAIASPPASLKFRKWRVMQLAAFGS